MLAPLWLTLQIALLATLVAGAVGIALGWWMARRDFLGKDTADALLMLPMAVSYTHLTLPTIYPV